MTDRGSLAHTAGRTGATIGGAVLSGLVRTLAAVRPAAKPMHPRGQVRSGRLHRHGAPTPTGVAFLDAVSVDDVLVRESRGIGLPRWAPDIQGLAVRVPDPEGGHADLLLSSTGLGPVTRYVLTLSRTPEGRPMTTLLPYSSVAGPVLIGAEYMAHDRLELSFAVGSGPFTLFADLVLSSTDGGDEDVTFDAVLHTPAGLEQYDVVRRLREPAYRTARESRRG